MSPKRNIRFRFMIAAIACLAANTALCHRLSVFAWVDGSQIAGEAYYAGGGKAANLPLVVLDAEKREVGKTSTDAEGTFRLQRPSVPGDLILQVNAGEGHAGQFVLHHTLAASAPAEQTAGQPTAPKGAVLPASHEFEALLDQKLAPINEQIARLSQQRNTLQDALTGIGFILGIFGAAALARSRRKI